MNSLRNLSIERLYFILSHSDADIKDTEVIDINNKLNFKLKLLFRRKSQKHCISQWYFYFTGRPKD